jgi:hypothetical protein
MLTALEQAGVEQDQARDSVIRMLRACAQAHAAAGGKY